MTRRIWSLGRRHHRSVLEIVLNGDDVQTALEARLARHMEKDSPTAGSHLGRLLTMGENILTMGKSENTIGTDDPNAPRKTLAPFGFGFP